VAEKLASESWFAKVPVLPYVPFHTGTDATTGEAAMEEIWRIKRDGTLSGLGVWVLMPRLRVRHSNVSGPQSWVTIALSVLEQPLVNDGANGLNTLGAGWKTAEKAVMEAARTLHHWRYDGVNLLYVEGDWLSVNRERYSQGVRGYDLSIQGCLFQTSQAKAPQVTITIGSGTCTLDATGEDSIYYTTDGSLPTAGATLYSAPFAVASGTTVRAVSLKSGSLASDVAQATA
jgi:hypothetical protein